MSEKPKSNLRFIVGLIGFVLIIALAYSGGKVFGKNIAQNQNAADTAQQNN
jgi:hypothetical protein